jgi:dihydrolipoamide dehydrogenase
MSEAIKTKVLVIGGGPGGYVAAIRAGQLGLETVLVEGDRLGGACLIRGCIPSKALIHAASQYFNMLETARDGRLGIELGMPPKLNFGKTIGWKDGIVDRLSSGVSMLLKRANVRVISGWAQFSDAKNCRVETSGGSVSIMADHVILATGSHPVELPFLPFSGSVISSTQALALQEVPETLVIVGAGYIGLELGTAFAKLGAKVTIVEARNQILPLYDTKLVEPVQRWLSRHGVVVYTGANALSHENSALKIETNQGQLLSLPAEKILVTVGRKPNTQGWGLDRMNLVMSGGFVQVDERCATSTRNVWAIGDLVSEPMLAHKASAQGAMVAEIITGQRRRFAPMAIPSVCFTEPEIVSVGHLPDALPADMETLIGQFPMAANGRALSIDATDGFVRVVAQKSDHRIIGIQAVGAHMSELSGEFATLLEMGAVLEDVGGIIHTHPTQSEAIFEASLKALGHAIHI